VRFAAISSILEGSVVRELLARDRVVSEGRGRREGGRDRRLFPDKFNI